MVLLGGLQTLIGPVVGSSVFLLLQDSFIGITQYWHALFGGVILLLVLVFPQGIAGYVRQLSERFSQSKATASQPQPLTKEATQ